VCRAPPRVGNPGYTARNVSLNTGSRQDWNGIEDRANPLDPDNRIGAVIMRSGSGTRKTAARRFATVMAAVGALLMSSGIALMAASTTASAVPFKNVDHKVVICHGTSSEGNPYVGISIDKHAVKAHQDHSHVWAGDTWWHGVFHQGGSVKMDVLAVPGATEEAQLAYCNAAPEPAPVVTPTPNVSPPTSQVSPPKAHVKGKVEAKTEVKAQPTTPTVVHAGLAGSGTSVGTGLGLILAGLVLMAGAGGLALEGGEPKETS
jgi:hypothetical protein